MARFGNTGASSLVRSAQAAFDRQQTYNDQIQAYQYDLSPKTQQDLQAYQQYLNNRIQQTSDPSKALTLQKTITSAYRTFNSAEIGRLSDQVVSGNMSNTDKYNQMLHLYQQAGANGDANLQQTIGNQLDRLDVTIQNEAQARANAAASAGRAASAAASSGYSGAIKKLDLGLKQAQASLASGDISAEQYRGFTAQLLLQKAMAYDSQSRDPNLTQSERDTASINLMSLSNNDQFKLAAGQKTMDLINNGDPLTPENGADLNPLLSVTGSVATHYKPANTASGFDVGYENLKPIGQDMQGNPVYPQNGAQLNRSGKPSQYLFSGQQRNSQGGLTPGLDLVDVNPQINTQTGQPTGQYTYVNPIKGNTYSNTPIVVNANQQASLPRIPQKYLDTLSPDQQKALLNQTSTQTPVSALDYAKELFKPDKNFISDSEKTLGGGVHMLGKAAGFLSNPVSATGNFLTNIFNRSAQAAAIQQQRDHLAALAQQQAEAQRQAAVAQSQAVARNAALPGPRIQPNLAQRFGAALPAPSQRPTAPQIGSALAQVGIKPAGVPSNAIFSNPAPAPAPKPPSFLQKVGNFFKGLF